MKGRLDVFGFEMPVVQPIVIATALAAMLFLYLIVQKTRMGTAMRAVSEDRDAAALMGIDVNKVIIFTFILGGCMAGIGGVLYCFVYKQIYYFTGFFPGIKAFCAAVLGGIGNIPGAMSAFFAGLWVTHTSSKSGFGMRIAQGLGAGDRGGGGGRGAGRDGRAGPRLRPADQAFRRAGRGRSPGPLGGRGRHPQRDRADGAGKNTVFNCIMEFYPPDGGEILFLGLSLEVDTDEIVTLIGANGAGKTTTLNAICSILAPAEGEVRFEGEVLTYVAPHDVVGRGIVQIPEGRRIFGRLTVGENLRMGAFLRTDKQEVRQSEEHVLAMFPVLRERIGQVAGTLSGGEQQMLAMARGLMSKPRVLLLDEPSMGLAPMLVETIFDAVLAIRKEGVPVLLVEQNAFMALQIADRGYVMETGEIVLEGTGQALLENDEVQRAYLG